MKRKAFTLIELLVVVAIIALLISILLPSLSRAREITKRAVCASNLRGVGQGCKIYSNESQDWYPTSPYRYPDLQGTPQLDYITMMGKNLLTQLDTNTDNQVHPSRSLFMLVIDGTTSAKQFVCPSSGDGEDDLRNKSGSQQVACQPGVNRFDFKGYPFMSYGYQYPFGLKARPSENLDTRMVILADKGPWFQSGTTNATTGVTPDAWRGGSGQGEELLIADANTETKVLNLDNERWRPYNSRNHNGEGQNVLYNDGHAVFEKRPIVGVNTDNIYTIQRTWDTLLGGLLGSKPSDELVPLSQTDSVVIP